MSDLTPEQRASIQELPEHLRPFAEILTRGFASTLAAIGEFEQEQEAARQHWRQRKLRRTGL